MKKLSKLIALAVALIGVTFAGCSNLVDDATIEGETITGGKQVTLTATSDGDLVTFSSGSSRIIMPDQLNVSSGYKFWLWGTNKTNGKSLDFQNVEFTANGTNTTKGTVTINLEVATYELFLACCKTGTPATDPTTSQEAINSAVLYATATVDFSSGDTANFYLSPYKLRANGEYSLKLKLDGWDATGYKTTVGIYYANSGTALKETEDAGINKTTDTIFASADIAPGTYNFIVTFIPTDTSLTKKYYYNDKIVILSNQTTEKSILIPELIDKKPADPEKLGVRYVLPTSETQDTYDVQFTWVDKAYNESNFVLEIVDFTNVAAPTGFDDAITSLAGATGASNAALDTAWATVLASKANETIYSFGKNIGVSVNGAATATDKGYFYNNPEYWVAGSCNINSNYAVVSLQLGHRYVARLAAHNDVGNSAYLYADLTGATVTGDGVEYNRYEAAGATGNDTVNKVATSALTKFGADATEINLYRITYNLFGGSFYEASTTGGAIPTKAANVALTDVTGLNSNKTSVVQYGVQRTKGSADKLLNPLYAPTATSGKYGVLYKGTNRWTEWLVGSISGDAYTTSYNAAVTSGTTPAYNDSTPEPVEYMKWKPASGATSAGPDADIVGFSNIDLYATYRVTSGIVDIDHSADFNITDGSNDKDGNPTVDMVNLFYATTAGFPTALATAGTEATKENGTFIFVKSTAADSNAGTATPALFLYPCLANDATNHVLNGVGISYYKVEYEVLQDGVTNVQTSVAATPATNTMKFAGKDASGTATTSAKVSWVEIPIGALSKGTYTIMIHAYAYTEQSEYSYPIQIELRDPSNTTGGAGGTFSNTPVTFTVADIGTATIADITTADLTSVTPAGCVTVGVSGGTVTLTPAAQGTATLTVTDSTSATQNFSVTVSATGTITVTGVTLH